MQEQLDTARKDANRQQFENAKLIARAEFLDERLKLHTTELERHIAEASSLGEQKARLSSSLLALEKQLELTRFAFFALLPGCMNADYLFAETSLRTPSGKGSSS